MFVLVYNNGAETVSSDNLAWAYPTFDHAYHEMVRQLEEAAAKEGMTLLEHDGSGDFEGYYDDDVELSEWQGFIDNDGALLDTTDERWVIHEIPGAFIPKEACEGFSKSIRKAADMYGDDERDDWFDADDICQKVCWELEEYLG